MQFRIPFTDTKIAIGQTPESEGRGYSRGKFATDTGHDTSGIKVDSRALYTAWRNSGDIYACVREIRQNVGIGGYHWYDPNDPEKERPAPPKLVTLVESIFRYEYGSFRRFKDTVLDPHLIAGNTYLEKIRNPNKEIIGLKALDPRTMAIVTDEFGVVYRYIQVHPESDSKVVEPVVFEPTDIIHWKHGSDPNNEAFGFSPMETILWDARADLSAMVSNYFFFENNAVPAVQYILEKDLSPESVNAIVEMIRKNFKGAKNRNRATVMQGVKEIKPVGISQQDMQFLDGRRFTTEKVCAAFGVPKVMLGYTEGVNYTNHEGQTMSFYEGTVREYETSFEEDIINGDLIPSLGLEGQIAFAFKTANFDSKATVWDRAIRGRAAGLVTINNARRLVGLDPIDPAVHGDMGDVIILGEGNGAVPLTDVGVDPADPQQQADDLANKIVDLEQYNRSDVRKGS
jgi:Phage-related protein